MKKSNSANKADAKENSNLQGTEHRDKLCLDSGCTAHLCKSATKFVIITDRNVGKLNSASNTSTEIKARRTVLINTQVQGRMKNVNNAVYVANLRTNLSVAKITDKSFKVIFE